MPSQGQTTSACPPTHWALNTVLSVGIPAFCFTASSGGHAALRHVRRHCLSTALSDAPPSGFTSGAGAAWGYFILCTWLTYLIADAIVLLVSLHVKREHMSLAGNCQGCARLPWAVLLLRLHGGKSLMAALHSRPLSCLGNSRCRTLPQRPYVGLLLIQLHVSLHSCAEPSSGSPVLCFFVHGQATVPI